LVIDLFQLEVFLFPFFDLSGFAFTDLNESFDFSAQKSDLIFKLTDGIKLRAEFIFIVADFVSEFFDFAVSGIDDFFLSLYFEFKAVGFVKVDF